MAFSLTTRLTTLTAILALSVACGDKGGEGANPGECGPRRQR